MHTSVGDIRDVITWFNRRSTSERILCLMVTATRRDWDLLGNLFAQRGRINAQLGPDVAFFLFSPLSTIAEVVARDDSLGRFLVIPGLTEADSARTLDAWRSLSIEDLDASARDQVIQHTQSVSDEIRRYFDLERDMLPCMVFLTKNNDTPFVVRTSDAASVKLVEQLFAELRRVAETLTVSGLLDLPYRLAQTQALVTQREDAEKICERERLTLQTAIPAARASLEEIGLGGLLDGLNPESASKVFEMLGLSRDPRARPSHDESVVLRVRQALLEERVHQQLRAVRTAGERLRKNTYKSSELTAQIEARLAADLNPKRVSTQLHTTELELEDICERFEGKFRRHRYAMSLRTFIQFVAQIAPVSKQVADAGKAVVDIESRLSSQHRTR